MKKILLVIPSNKGTIALCSLNLYKALSKQNDVTVKCVMMHKYKDGFEELEDCEWFINHTSSGIKRMLIGIQQILWLKSIKKRFNPDTTISTLFSCSTVNVLSGGKELKIGIFHSPHQQVKSVGRFAYLSTLLIYHCVYPFLDKLYCVSNEVKNTILKSFPSISDKKLEVVYNIHDTDRIQKLAIEELSDEERRIFENPVVLYCGRLDRNKSPERLLRGFMDSNLLLGAYQLVYIGQDTDQLWEELKESARKMGIIRNIHYLGPKKNPYKYMKRARLLVSCSLSEGLPGVLIESLLLGVPVVSTNSSEGVWEILGCAKDYNPQLNKYYIADNGVITSNIGDYNIDIPNLRWALEYVTSPSYSTMPFKFADKISPESVVNKLIS